MHTLIEQVRLAVPFDIPEQVLCLGTCRGCAKKLLEFLDTELNHWEYRLGDGETPSLGDIQRLTKQSRKIYSALQKNGVVPTC